MTRYIFSKGKITKDERVFQMLPRQKTGQSESVVLLITDGMDTPEYDKDDDSEELHTLIESRRTIGKSKSDSSNGNHLEQK